jgi:hypothetical protein
MLQWIQGLATGWFSDILKFGALALITWLLGRANKKYPNWHVSVRDYVTLFALVAITWFAFTGKGIIQAPSTTPDNVESNIRTWLDTFNYSVRVIKDNPPDIIFALEATNVYGQQLVILRPKARDNYIQLQMTAVPPLDYQNRFTKLSESDKKEYLGQVSLEILKARTHSFNFVGLPKLVEVSHSIPITNDLNADSFIREVDTEIQNEMIVMSQLDFDLGGVLAKQK